MIFRKLTAWLVLILLLVACGDPGREDTSSRSNATRTATRQAQGGIYRTPLQNSPSTLDPAFIQDAYGVYVVQQIFDGLVKFDRDMMVIPSLAKSWRVEEGGRRYIFSLREDARFHDGTLVRAEDVVFSLERLLRVDPPSVLLPHLLKIVGAEDFREEKTDHVPGLSAESTDTVVVRLEEGHTPFLTALGMYQAKIVPKKLVLDMGDGFGLLPVGSGPFEFAEWIRNDLIRLKRNDAYHGPAAHLQEVHFRIYPGGEIDRIVEDFKAGRLEEIPVYGSIRDQIDTLPGLQLLHRPALSLLFYGLRMDAFPLDRGRLREALSLAIDKQALVTEVYQNMFQEARTILPPGMPGFTPKEPAGDDSLMQARELIEQVEAEYGTIPALEIVSASKSAFSEAELEFIASAWERLGLVVHKKFITDWSQFEDYIRSDAVQVFRYVWTADMPDPDNFISPLFASDSPANFMHFHNKELDQTMVQARSLTDPVERAELYEELEGKILELHPIIPLFYLSTTRAYQPYVRDVFLTPLGWQDLRLVHVWLD